MKAAVIHHNLSITMENSDPQVSPCSQPLNTKVLSESQSVDPVGLVVFVLGQDNLTQQSDTRRRT